MSDLSHVILSDDGSHTIRSEQFGVTYHSRHGAIQETDTVFIKAGLQYQVQQDLKRISILEMGFGTGLNALMTLMVELPSGVVVDYHTIEAYPIDLQTAASLNYLELLQAGEEQSAQFLQMHSCRANERQDLAPHFAFTKHITPIENFTTAERFDVIYYDAFAPTAQEHLWTPEMMSRLATYSNIGCALVSYCAKGSFKRALRSSGYEVSGLPGPIGKREMTRAIYVGRP